MSTEADPKPAPSLDESVESLLNEMSQTAERLNAELDASKSTPKAAEAVEAPLGDLAAAVDEMVKEVAAATPNPAAPKPTAPASPPTGLADEPATAEAQAGHPSPVEVAQTPDSAEHASDPTAEATQDDDDGVESLASDAFASLSDELLAGLDRDGPTIVVGNAPATGAGGLTGSGGESFDSLTDELLSGLGEPKPAPVEEAPVAKERAPTPPPPEPEPAPVQASTLPPAEPPPVEEQQHTTTVARRVLHAAGHAAGQVASKAEPHALKAVAKISSPLQSRPRTFRDTLGWLGIYTLFVGLTLLVYVGFIHKAPSPEPAHPGVKLADRNDHKGAAGEVLRSEEHGQAEGHGGEHGDAGHGGGGGHGEAASKDAHGKKDDGHGAKKDDGAKKGAVKAPAAPKLPTPQFKAGPGAAKKDAKAEPKKDAGHGGGH